MTRTASLFVAVFLLTLTVTLSVRVLSAETPWQAKIDPALTQQFQHNTINQFFVVLAENAKLGAETTRNTAAKGASTHELLRSHAANSQYGLLAFLDEAAIAHQSFWIANVVLVEGDQSTVEQLARREDVARIHTNQRLEAPKPSNQTLARPAAAVPWGISKVKADQVWATLNITGTGAIVAGQDTGYDWDHEALKQAYRGWDGSTVDHNYNWHDAIHQLMGHTTANPCGLDSAEPCDDNGHGTHTMGTIVGDNGAAEQIGMAPGAKWISCRNMERGVGTLATYIECFQWFVAPTDLAGNNPDPNKAPHVINNSWGCPSTEGCNISNFATMQTVVDNVKAAGIVVVASAGNNGPMCETVSSPAAIFDSSFSVTATTSTDAIAFFSSRGPVMADGSQRMKPDISAPGVSVRSSLPNNAYGSKQGTSMAGPHVAGLVALIISANPNLAGQVDVIEHIIRSSAEPLTTDEACGGDSTTAVPNHTFGFGRIDALAAVTMAQSYVPTSVTLSTTSTSSPNPAVPTIWIALTTVILLSVTARLVQKQY